MEILELGKLPEEKVYIGKCTYCKTRVRFKRDEAKSYSDSSNADYTLVSVECPLCSRTISVED